MTRDQRANSLPPPTILYTSPNPEQSLPLANGHLTVSSASSSFALRSAPLPPPPVPYPAPCAPPIPQPTAEQEQRMLGSSLPPKGSHSAQNSPSRTPTRSGWGIRRKSHDPQGRLPAVDHGTGYHVVFPRSFPP